MGQHYLGNPNPLTILALQSQISTVILRTVSKFSPMIWHKNEFKNEGENEFKKLKSGTI